MVASGQMSATISRMPKMALSRSRIRSRRRKRAITSLSLFGHPHAQQSGRAEDKHRDENPEDHNLRPFGTDVEIAEGGDQADGQPAERSTWDVADAAEYRRRKGDEPGMESKVVGDRVEVEAPDEAACPGKQCADEEGGRDGAVDVDAHELGRVPVLRCGTHRLAELAPVDEDREQGDQDRRCHHHEHILEPDENSADVRLPTLTVRQQVREVDGCRTVPQEHDPLQGERHPDGGDQRRQSRRVAKRAVRDSLDTDVDDTHDEHHDREDEEERDQVADLKGVLVSGKEGDQRRNDVSGQREHVAMSEVDELDDAVDHRVAERDQGVDRAIGQAEDQDLRELGGIEYRLSGEKHQEGSGEDEETEVGNAHPPEASGSDSLQRLEPGSHSARVQRPLPKRSGGGPGWTFYIDSEWLRLVTPWRSRRSLCTRSTSSSQFCRRRRSS